MASGDEALGPIRKEARMSFRLTGNPRFRAQVPRNSLGRDSECTHAGPSSLPAIAVAATAGTGASRLVPGTIARLVSNCSCSAISRGAPDFVMAEAEV
jgi:hypothetical protein